MPDFPVPFGARYVVDRAFLDQRSAGAQDALARCGVETSGFFVVISESILFMEPIARDFARRPFIILLRQH
jgi:hypothetical protein